MASKEVIMFWGFLWNLKNYNFINVLIYMIVYSSQCWESLNESKNMFTARECGFKL